MIMAKPTYEVAAEIVQSVVEARGAAITSQGTPSGMVGNLINTHLSDEAVVSLYEKVLKSLNDSFN